MLDYRHGFSAPPADSAWKPYDPDRPPSNPSPMDDEFDKGYLDLSKWTVHEDTGGNYAITFANSLCNIALTTTSSTTYRYACLRQSPPNGPYRFRAKFFIPPCDAFIATHLSPIMVSTGKVVFNCYMRHTGQQYVFSTYTGRFTNGTYNSNDRICANGVSNIVYQEMEYDGTNVIFRFSFDGTFFIEMWREAAATHLGGAPTGILVGMHPYNNVNGLFKPFVSIDWFRRVA